MFNFLSFFKPKVKIPKELLSEINLFISGLYVDPKFSGARFSRDAVHETDTESTAKYSEDIGSFSEELPDNPYSGLYDFYSSEQKVKMAKDFDLSIAGMSFIYRSHKTFVEMVQEHIREKNLKDTDVYKAAGIDRRLFSHMMSDKSYQPSKDTAIAVCLGLNLSLSQTYALLHAAGFTLSSSIKRDLVFKFFILNEKYDLQIINETLYSLGYKTLGR